MIRDLPRGRERAPQHATECHMNTPRKKTASAGWRLLDDRPPTFRGWLSTDEGEIGRRESRGRTEIVDVHLLDGSPHPFGDYRVTSSNGSSYTVEIRSPATHVNSCGCRDHRANRLGTCKHIEGVRHRLRGERAAPPKRRTPKGQVSSGRIEIFVDERDDRAVRMTVRNARLASARSSRLLAFALAAAKRASVSRTAVRSPDRSSATRGWAGTPAHGGASA